MVVESMRSKYGVDFPIFDKILCNGMETCDLYKFLRTKSELFDPKQRRAREIPWNFAKFLIDAETGQVLKYYNPRINPVHLLPDIEE